MMYAAQESVEFDEDAALAVLDRMRERTSANGRNGTNGTGPRAEETEPALATG